MLALELDRFLEERLCRDGEELGLVGRPVRDTVFGIQLVGELMQHDVVAVDRIARPTDGVVPRDHHHTVSPRLAYQTRGGPGDLARPGRPGELGNESVRIHEHRPERRIAWTLEMEQQQARPGRDRDLHLFREGESTASLEVFLRQKDLRQPEQAVSLVRAQAASEWDI